LERQRDHAADALIVDIGICFVVDAVASRFDASQQRFGSIHEFGVGHYNFAMSCVSQILVSSAVRALFLAASVVALLGGCGQKGPLFIPTGEAASSRATLPQTLAPGRPASAPPVTGTAAPIPTQ
jgi:predicted small lipoprotein YifL